MGASKQPCTTIKFILPVLAAIFAVNQAVIRPLEPTTTSVPTPSVSCPPEVYPFKNDSGLLGTRLRDLGMPEGTFHQLLTYAQGSLRYRRNIYTQLNESYISRLRNARIETDLLFQSMLSTYEKNLKRLGLWRPSSSSSSAKSPSASSDKRGTSNSTKGSSPGTDEFKSSSSQGRATSKPDLTNTRDALPPCVRIQRGKERIELIKKALLLLLLALPVTEEDLSEAAMEEDLEYFFLRMEGRNLIHPSEDRTAACPPCQMRGWDGTCRQLFFCKGGKNISHVIREVTHPPTRRSLPLSSTGK
ncbi:uncharacterized protein LOC143029907 [Oratosquilla oratoria]|uniref:uncharacterized protein LOC143029907 n=1 Tax=Oratosquilla oratoria TaxID=337810 RepID=UPI003F75C715